MNLEKPTSTNCPIMARRPASPTGTICSSGRPRARRARGDERQRRHVGALWCVGEADAEVLRTDGPAVLGGHPVDHRLARRGVLGRAESGDPPVGQAAAALESRRDVAAQPDVEGVLDRSGRDRDVGEGPRRALVTDHVAGPQAPQHRQRIVHQQGTGGARDPDGAALRTDVEPGHEREEEAPARERVERGDRLGQPDEVAARQQHRRPDLEPRGTHPTPRPARRAGRARAATAPRGATASRIRCRDGLRQREHRLGTEALASRADPDPDLHGASATAATARADPVVVHVAVRDEADDLGRDGMGQHPVTLQVGHELVGVRRG